MPWWMAQVPWLLQEGNGGGGSGLGSLLIPLVLVFVIFYFLLIRPERKKQEEHREMLEGLEKDDRVVTQGGIIGLVKRVKENEVTLLVNEDKNVRLKVLKTSIMGKMSEIAEEETAKAGQ